jgi:putative oxidoreductase
MRSPLVLLRAGVATLLFIHGAYRAATGGVPLFGEWLSSIGFPAGVAWAAAVTAIEVAASVMLAAGRFVLPITGYLIFQLLLGIVLVHARDGWFVVGAGRNGMEYSVLLILCLVVIAWDQRRQKA